MNRQSKQIHSKRRNEIQTHLVRVMLCRSKQRHNRSEERIHTHTHLERLPYLVRAGRLMETITRTHN